MTKNLNKYWILLLFSIIIPSCKQVSMNKVNLDLYLDEPILNKSQTEIPKNILKILEPLECGENNVIVELTVHRYDFDSIRTLKPEFSLSGMNSFRQMMGVLSFKHHQTIFSDNPVFDSNEIFYVQSAENHSLDNEKNIEKDDSFFYFNKNNPTSSNPDKQVFSDFKSLTKALRSSLCNSDKTQYAILYKSVTNDDVKVKSVVDNDEENTESENEDALINKLFNKIGDKDVDPEKRLELVDQNLSLFSNNAMVKVIGKNGTVFRPTPIQDYLRKIAFSRSLESIDSIKGFKNEDSLYWEVRLKENHIHKLQY